MKKEKKFYDVRVTVGDLPVEYDPLNKGAIEKLAYANKIGLGKVIRGDSHEKKSQPERILTSQKGKRCISSSIASGPKTRRTK